MIKIQIKSIWGSLLFEWESEKNTIAETVGEAIKAGANLVRANLVRANLESANLYGANLVRANLYGANLESANLESANLVRANLESANLYGANLECANLYGANLVRANLESANLYGANLECAKTDKRYVQFAGIGLIGRSTLYCVEDNAVRCGCFRGTIEQFEAQIRETHAENPQHLKEYLAGVEFLKSLSKK